MGQKSSKNKNKKNNNSSKSGSLASSPKNHHTTLQNRRSSNVPGLTTPTTPKEQELPAFGQQLFHFPLFGAREFITPFAEQMFISTASQHVSHLYFAQYDRLTDPARDFPDLRTRQRDITKKDDQLSQLPTNNLLNLPENNTNRPEPRCQAYRTTITKEQFLDHSYLSNNPILMPTKVQLTKNDYATINPELVFDFQCVALPASATIQESFNGLGDIGTRFYSYSPQASSSGTQNWTPPIMDVLDEFRCFIGTQFQESYWDVDVQLTSNLSALTKSAALDLYRFHNFENVNLPFIPFISLFLDMKSIQNRIWFELWLKQRLAELNADCVVSILEKPIHIFLFNYGPDIPTEDQSNITPSLSLSNDIHDPTSTPSTTTPFTHHSVLQLCLRYHLNPKQIVLHSFPIDFNDWPDFVKLFDKITLRTYLSFFHSNNKQYISLCESYKKYPCSSALTEPLLHRELILPPRSPPPKIFVNDELDPAIGRITYIQPIINSIPRLPIPLSYLKYIQQQHEQQQQQQLLLMFNTVPITLDFAVPISFYFPSHDISSVEEEPSIYISDANSPMNNSVNTESMGYILDVLTDRPFGTSPPPTISFSPSSCYLDTPVGLITHGVEEAPLYDIELDVQFPPTDGDMLLLDEHPRFYRAPYPPLVRTLPINTNQNEHNNNNNNQAISRDSGNHNQYNIHQVKFRFEPTKEHNLLSPLSPFGQIYSIYIVDCSALVNTTNNNIKNMTGEKLCDLLPRELLRHLHNAHSSVHIFLLSSMKPDPPELDDRAPSLLQFPSLLQMSSIILKSGISGNSFNETNNTSGMSPFNLNKQRTLQQENKENSHNGSISNNKNSSHFGTNNTQTNTNNNGENSTSNNTHQTNDIRHSGHALSTSSDSARPSDTIPTSTTSLFVSPKLNNNITIDLNSLPSELDLERISSTSNPHHQQHQRSFMTSPSSNNPISPAQARHTFTLSGTSSVFTQSKAIFSEEIFKNATNVLTERGLLRNGQGSNIIFHETTLWELRELIKSISNDELLHRLNQYYTILAKNINGNNSTSKK